MNKIAISKIIPRLGNDRPENGTGTQTFQSVRTAEFYSAVLDGGTRAVASHCTCSWQDLDWGEISGTKGPLGAQADSLPVFHGLAVYELPYRA